LVAPRVDLVRAVLERRVDLGLARREPLRLKRGSFAGMLLVSCGFLALALGWWLLQVSPAGSVEGCLRDLLGIREPPRILDLSLKSRWIRASELEDVEVVFSRDLESPGELRIEAGGVRDAQPLHRTSAGRYRARLRPCQGTVLLRVAVGRWTSPAFEYLVYPVPKLRITDPSEGSPVKGNDLRVAGSCQYDGTISRAFVFFSDYVGLQRGFELRDFARKDDGWRVDVQVPLGLLGARSGKVLGI